MTAQTETTETKSRKGIGGPKTPEGKARVRLNALKTGLYADSSPGRQLVGEAVGVTFESVLEGMTDCYHPVGAIEEALVRRIARCTWKLRIIEAIEDYQLEYAQIGCAPGKRMERLSIIERRIDVQLHRAITALALKRRQDLQNMKNKLAELPPPGKWPRPEEDPLPSSSGPNRSANSKRPANGHSQAPSPWEELRRVVHEARDEVLAKGGAPTPSGENLADRLRRTGSARPTSPRP